MLSKKDGEEIISMANEYIDRGLRIREFANMLHIPLCRFYEGKSCEEPLFKKKIVNALRKVSKIVKLEVPPAVAYLNCAK